MNDQTPLPAPGWYADPAAPATALRYWDGATWTEHVHPLEATDSAPADAGRDAAAAPADPDRAAAAAPADASPGAADADQGAPAPAAPDTGVPSADDGVAEATASDDGAPAEGPGTGTGTDAAESDPPAEPVSQAVPPVEVAPQQRPDPSSAAAQPNPYAAAQQPDPYSSAPRPNPYATAHQQNPSVTAPQQNPYSSAPQHPAPPAAPWAQGPGNPYQSAQAPQYGAPAGPPKSRAGLWIGLGIGGGVLLLLVIGLVIAVVAFFASIGNSMRGYEPAPLPSYDLDAPGGEAPDIDGEIYGMGDPFVIPDLAGTGEGWEVTVVDFSADAAEAASAAPGNKAFAVLVEVTNLGGVALDPYFAMTPTFVGDDGLEYTDLGMIEPGLFDVDTVEPGATSRFTATFEVPQDLEDAGTLLLYDGYMEEYFAVAVG